MKDQTIKSLTPVQFFGEGNNGNWGARLRMKDGAELFAGFDEKYTLAQAQAVIQANPDNNPVGCSVLGIEHVAPYQPLPAGVRAKA